MKVFPFFLVLILLSAFMGLGKVISLPDLVDPRTIDVDGSRIYISEKTTIHIYSRGDFNLEKKFGREGEGPREFKQKVLSLDIQADFILVNSLGKVSFFRKDGTYIKELRPANHMDMKFRSLGKGFVGGRMVGEDNILYWTINLYDVFLKKVKEIFRQEREVQFGGKGTKIYREPRTYYTLNGKLFIVRGDYSAVEVLDVSGKFLYSITHNWEKIRVSEKNKNEVKQYLQTNPETGPFLDAIKPIQFPDYFPAIRNYFLADEKLYVISYQKKGDKSLCLIFNIKGKLLKRVYIPYRFKNPVDEYPAAFKDKKLFQLIENEDSETWELHINQIY